MTLILYLLYLCIALLSFDHVCGLGGSTLPFEWSDSTLDKLSALPTEAEAEAQREDSLVWKTLSGRKPLLIGHRGDARFFPSHSLASISIGIDEGADVIEPDLQLSSDGILVVSHDLTLSQSTNIREHIENNALWAQRLRTDFSLPLSHRLTTSNDFLLSDFSWEELSKLTLRQSNAPQRTHVFDSQFSFFTFESYIKLIIHRSVEVGRRIQIAPELKHTGWYSEKYLKAKGQNYTNFFEDEYVRLLQKYKMVEHGMVAFTQCAESHTLIYLRSVLPDMKLMQVVYPPKPDKTEIDSGLDGHSRFLFDFYLSPKGAEYVSKFADYVGISKEYYRHNASQLWEAAVANAPPQSPMHNVSLYRRSVDASFGEYVSASNLLSLYHSVNVSVILWLARSPKEEGAVTSEEQWKEEMQHWFQNGVDGIFVEKVFAAVAARDMAAQKLRSMPPSEGRVQVEAEGNSPLVIATSIGALGGFVIAGMVYWCCNCGDAAHVTLRSSAFKYGEVEQAEHVELTMQSISESRLQSGKGAWHGHDNGHDHGHDNEDEEFDP